MGISGHLLHGLNFMIGDNELFPTSNFIQSGVHKDIFYDHFCFCFY